MTFSRLNLCFQLNLCCLCIKVGRDDPGDAVVTEARTCKWKEYLLKYYEKEGPEVY